MKKVIGLILVCLLLCSCGTTSTKTSKEQIWSECMLPLNPVGTCPTYQDAKKFGFEPVYKLYDQAKSIADEKARAYGEPEYKNMFLADCTVFEGGYAVLFSFVYSCGSINVSADKNGNDKKIR